MWETRVVVGGRFPSPVGRRGLIAAFHRTSASIARSPGRAGIDQGRGVQPGWIERAFFAGLFVGPGCGCDRWGGRSGSVKVESAITVSVVPELELAEAKDRAAIVDGLEGDSLADQCLAQKEQLPFPHGVAAASNAPDLAVAGILDLR